MGSDQHSWCKKDRVNCPVQHFYHSGTYAQQKCWHRDANQLKFEVADHQVSGLGSCKERRSAILVKNGLNFTQLVEISEQSKSIDTVWGVLEWDGNRLLFGTTYLKLGYEKGVMEFLKMLKCAKKMAKIHICKGITTMGDFNA